MTLTYPAINDARSIVWLVPGATKGEMLRRLVADDRWTVMGAWQRRQLRE